MISRSTITGLGSSADLPNRIIVLDFNSLQDIASRIQSRLHVDLLAVTSPPPAGDASGLKKANNFRLILLETIRNGFDIQIEQPKKYLERKEHEFLSAVNKKLACGAKRSRAIRTYIFLDHFQPFMIPAISSLVQYENLRLIISTNVHPNGFMPWRILMSFEITHISTYGNPPTFEPWRNLDEYELVTLHCILNVVMETVNISGPIKVRSLVDFIERHLTEIPHAHKIYEGLMIKVLDKLNRLNLISLKKLGGSHVDWKINVAEHFLDEDVRHRLELSVTRLHLLKENKNKILFRSLFNIYLQRESSAYGLFSQLRHNYFDPSTYRCMREVIICAQNQAQLEFLDGRQVLRLPVRNLCNHLLVSLEESDKRTEFISVASLLYHWMGQSNFVFEHNLSNNSVYFLPNIAECIGIIESRLQRHSVVHTYPRCSRVYNRFEDLMTEETEITEFRYHLLGRTPATTILHDSLTKKWIGKRTIDYLRFLIAHMCMTRTLVCGREVPEVPIDNINGQLARRLSDASYEYYFGKTYVKTEDYISYLQSLVPVLEYDAFRSRVIFLPDICNLSLDPDLFKDANENDDVTSKLDELGMDEEGFRSYLEESGMNIASRSQR